MPPTVASFVFALGVAGLFLLDRDDKARTSKALWIPVIWLLINGSRPVAEWLHPQPMQNLQNPHQYLDGNPIDAVIYSVLSAAGLIVLVRRRVQVGRLLGHNVPIVLFFSYCAFSALWSDYPDVSFKRWIKAASDLVMVLIVVTDSSPLAALKRLLARVGFVLIPASILLIKYYPLLGRRYVIVSISQWEMMPIGVAEHKNTLGMVCLVLGLGFVWSLLLAYRNREDANRTRRLVVYGSVIAMVVWLFIQANSMTAMSCFLLATAFFIATTTQTVARRRGLTYALLAVIVAIPFATLFMGVGGGALEQMGRDSTLTGRTDIWREAINMSGNPVLGTGFESFWLGSRAERLWQMFDFHPTQAHNGYIEIYLELGWTGVVILGAIIVIGLRNAVGTLRRNPDMGRIRLAYIAVGLIYNLTEAGFKMMTLTWFFFLISSVVVSQAAVQEASSPLPAGASGSFETWQPQGNSASISIRRRLEAI